MQQQLAPAGQLTVHQGQLVYEAPTKERITLKNDDDDRIPYLTHFLPLAVAGKLSEQEMHIVRREHDAVLQSVSSQYHQMAMTVVSQQQRTIDGLVGVLQTVASNNEPTPQPAIVQRETVIYGEDFAGKIVFVLSLVLGLCALSLLVCLTARFADYTSRPAPVNYQYR
jgi:hypothetical protein